MKIRSVGKVNTGGLTKSQIAYRAKKEKSRQQVKEFMALLDSSDKDKSQKETKVVVRRAVYGWGKTSLPEKDREYNIVSIDGQPIGSMSVGNLAQIKTFLKNNNMGSGSIEIIDKDSKKTMKIEEIEDEN